MMISSKPSQNCGTALPTTEIMRMSLIDPGPMEDSRQHPQNHAHQEAY